MISIACNKSNDFHWFRCRLRQFLHWTEDFYLKWNDTRRIFMLKVEMNSLSTNRQNDSHCGLHSRNRCFDKNIFEYKSRSRSAAKMMKKEPNLNSISIWNGCLFWNCLARLGLAWLGLAWIGLAWMSLYVITAWVNSNVRHKQTQTMTHWTNS